MVKFGDENMCIAGLAEAAGVKRKTIERYMRRNGREATLSRIANGGFPLDL